MKQTPNSLKAYFDPKNKKKFNTHRSKIIRVLFARPPRSRRQIAEITGLNEWQVGRRISEIEFIKQVGNVIEFGNKNALWSIDETLI